MIAAMPSAESKPRSRDKLLALIGVWAVAVAKPTLDVVGAAPEYWTANRIDIATAITIALALALLPPALLGGVIVAMKGGRRVRVVSSLLFGGFFAFLLSLAVYHSLSLVLGKPVVLIPVSLAVASLVTFFYWRSRVTRAFFSYYSVMALIVPVNFLFFSPTRSLLGGSETAAGGVEAQVTLKAPVVVVVFDELNLASLINSEGDIDARLFPNFSRLASISTWYQNATTNYGTTERSIPSLLTGRLQTGEAAGTSYKQNPRNLFTLVHAPDGVLAVEPVTRLCPPELSGEHSKGFSDAIRQVVADFWLIYQNIFVPDRYASRIRPIPKRFRDLASIGVPEGNVDIAALEVNLSAWFRDDHRESLVFLHLGLPHAPYQLNPDGTFYSKLGNYGMIGWIPREHRWDPHAPFYAVQAFQRYLLQTMYVDRVLGGILNSIERNGLLLETTLVVTADHGVAFTPGEKRRAVKFDPAVVGENNAIPLFWKSSGQLAGTKNTRNVELIDVLPTLLEAFGGGTGASNMDGRSMFSAEERDEKIFGGTPYPKDVWPAVLQANQRRSSEVSIIDNGNGSFFVRPEKYSFLVGRSVRDTANSEHTVKVENSLIFDQLASLDNSSAFRPNFVKGWLDDGSTVDILGVAVNGLIADVVDVFVDELGRRRFASVFDPSILKSSDNELEFVGVQFVRDGAVVLTLFRTFRESFHLVNGLLVNGKGTPLRLAPERLVGGFGGFNYRIPGTFGFRGWLGDRKTWKPARAYLVVYQGEQHLSRPTDFRPDLASVNEGLTRSGFKTAIRFQGERFRLEDFRMFVIFDEETYAEMRNVLGMQP